MNLILQTDSGSEIQTFSIPETGKITDEQAISMGRLIAKTITKSRDELEVYENKLEETCNCFWIKQTQEERKVMRNHSSECAIWDIII